MRIAPEYYDYSENRRNCSVPVDHEGAVFAVAAVTEQPNGKWESNGHDWGCNLNVISTRGALVTTVLSVDGIPRPRRIAPLPFTDQYVTHSACSLIPSGTSLVSSSMTPASNDPLFAEVTIPAVLNLVRLPAISGCASSWSVVHSQFINTNQGVAVWYATIDGLIPPAMPHLNLARSARESVMIVGMAEVIILAYYRQHESYAPKCPYSRPSDRNSEKLPTSRLMSALPRRLSDTQVNSH